AGRAFLRLPDSVYSVAISSSKRLYRDARSLKVQRNDQRTCLDYSVSKSATVRCTSRLLLSFHPLLSAFSSACKFHDRTACAIKRRHCASRLNSYLSPSTLIHRRSATKRRRRMLRRTDRHQTS